MSEFGKYINVPSRKGVFIPDITVEMFRNASLEGVEDLLASGEMEDISLPSAQPERKRGRWNCSDDMYESAVCSVCGWDTTEPWDHIRHWFNYCPNCGADLREVDDERPD